MRKLLTVILIFISILVNGQEKIHITEIDSCKCKTIIKSFKYFEKKVYKKNENYFYPQKPVVYFANGEKTSPPINKHIIIMLECIPVIIMMHADDLIYKIEKSELDKWDEWIKVYCEQDYLKYRKHHNFSSDTQK